MNDEKISGIMEYGLGMWSRFQYNGAKTKIIEKPKWLGIARLTSNEKYTDAQNFGDRLLAILMGKGYYHFATYNTDPPNMSVSGNIEYSADSESTWVYLYFCYKRFQEQQGSAIAYAIIHESIQ